MVTRSPIEELGDDDNCINIVIPEVLTGNPVFREGTA